MPNPNISTQDWYYHAPSKSSQNTEALEPPPASQIPGLSNFVEQPDEMEERRFRRKWIRDTDSKYIKLAKGGGRKNLLSYKAPPTEQQQAVRYPRVDWFDDYQENPENRASNPTPPLVELHRSKKMQQRTEPHRVIPEWYIHDQMETESNDDHYNQPTKTKKNVMAYDSMSAWEREAKNEEAEHSKRVRFPPLHDKRQTKNIPAFNVQQFPKRIVRPVQVESNPVDFSHLMSMGYQKDWFEEQNSKYIDEKKKKQLERVQHDEKRSHQMRDAIEMRRPRNVVGQDEDGQMFKLSRFQKIQPRVESFRT